jgi:H/ACA ribonucleoprotein complex subunit 3
MATTRILRCPACGTYALTEQCPCGSVRIPPRPPKYSPDDKYAEYRRKYKEIHPEESHARKMHPLEAMRKGLKEEDA